MKLLITGLLLVMMECCSCTPLERSDDGASMRLKRDAPRFRLHVGNLANVGNVGNVMSVGSSMSLVPGAEASAPAYAPYDPRSADEESHSLDDYVQSPYGYDQRPRYEYDQRLTNGYDQPPPYEFDQRPAYGYDQPPPNEYDQRLSNGYDERPPYGYDQPSSNGYDDRTPNKYFN